MSTEIVEAIERWQQASKQVCELAKLQYKPEECPLRHDHFQLSQALWGTGVWHWTCDFCGEEFEE
jgi:hypothetical protein